MSRGRSRNWEPTFDGDWAPTIQSSSKPRVVKKRTALLKGGKAYVQAGGGWVNDSEPEAEFQETVNKSKAMLKAVAPAETFAKE